MITDHHDGHGLNELCVIEKDEPDHEKGGGASHRYVIRRRADRVTTEELEAIPP